MTVSSTTSSLAFTGNGSTTTFAVSFPFLGTGSTAELTVIERIIATGAETTKSYTTHYTVTGGSGSTGAVVAATAPADTVQWHIIRNTTTTQTSDYVANDPFSANTIETNLDRLTMAGQERDGDIAKSFRYADTYTGGASAVLPDPTAGTGLSWNAAASALENAAISGTLPDPVTIAKGGTGATTAGAAATALGLTTGTASGNVPLVGTSSATTTLAGLVEIATDAELATGGAAIRAVTPSNIESLIIGKTEVTVAVGDSILLEHSGNLKRDTVQGILDLVPAAGWTEHGLQAHGGATSITFGANTGSDIIPAGTSQIVVMWDNMSFTSSVFGELLLGDGGGIERTGYTGYLRDNADSNVVNTTAFEIGTASAAANSHTGMCRLALLDPATNLWVGQFHTFSTNGTISQYGIYRKALTAALTQVEISNGTFDSGNFNLWYMG